MWRCSGKVWRDSSWGKYSKDYRGNGKEGVWVCDNWKLISFNKLLWDGMSWGFNICYLWM